MRYVPIVQCHRILCSSFHYLYHCIHQLSDDPWLTEQVLRGSWYMRSKQIDGGDKRRIMSSRCFFFRPLLWQYVRRRCRCQYSWFSHNILLYHGLISINMQDDYCIIMFEGPECLQGGVSLKSHLILVDGPLRPSDQFLRLHFARSVRVTVTSRKTMRSKRLRISWTNSVSTTARWILQILGGKLHLVPKSMLISSGRSWQSKSFFFCFSELYILPFI